ncbi:hypothetical protein [Nocardia vaccinii]|uniref:hypothetical protein n=1 Tax=Nocardia vaccinii TaxID=1822 RepID=UPI00082CC074|nr:hypothetical protein [Nocardia vaccinii]
MQIISRGTVVARTDGVGSRSPMRVRAVRRAPVPYAEVEPVEGGDRVAVLLTELERDFQIR